MVVRVLIAVMGVFVLPATTSAFTYVESIDGDIPSQNEAAPTPFGILGSGTHVISGTASAFTDWGDVFSMDLVPGDEIKSIDFVIAGHSGGFTARGRVFETPVFSGIEGNSFIADGSVSFISPPLSPGPFGFSAVFQTSGAPGTSFDWEWTITVPEPSSLALQIVALGTLLGLAQARRRASGC